jgi:hypothetical protein
MIATSAVILTNIYFLRERLATKEYKGIWDNKAIGYKDGLKMQQKFYSLPKRYKKIRSFK